MTGLATYGGHVPVLLDQVIASLTPRDGDTMVDATFGGGGYSAGLLDAADCCVLGLDRDPDAVRRGQAQASRWGDRLSVVEGRFSTLEQTVNEQVGGQVDGVVFDLGVSSYQLDEAHRGFSFRHDGPLDMRMGADGKSAADAVNHLDEAELAGLIGRLGEERRARAVARAIVAARKEAPIARTLELAEIVRGVVRRSPDGIDPATRTFQALRLWVNDELGELEQLGASPFYVSAIDTEVAAVDDDVVPDAQINVEVVILGDHPELGADGRAIDFGVKAEDLERSLRNR
ncbi:MAG: 16S rRNA (cytosine(1402)-N(4))-methyltransferase RsmH [Rhodospirillaceae bacterium]|nr:16S rRNA (cytosine(1402)-N(4))-methyltransferase RsmH [Rhodospirillaceae bacterium]